MSRTRYFTPSEVAVHNAPEDCWLSYLGHVYDLTPLCSEHAGSVLLKPILMHAGKDISHWFDPSTKDVRFLLQERSIIYTLIIIIFTD